MTVLIVSEPGKDGVFRFVEGLIHHLVGRSVRVHLAYSDRRSCDQLGGLVEFVRDHGGAALNLGVAGRPGLGDLAALQALRILARAVRPDIIHSHSSKAGVLARALPAFGVTAAQVYQPHAYAGMKPRLPLARRFYERVERVLGRRSLTINCSEDEQAYARRRLGLPAERSVYIPNGVDTAHFRPATAAEKLALRRRFRLPPEALVLGALGRAAAQKDPLTLYRAFARARETQPDLVLFHLGSGRLDPALDEFVRRRHLQGNIIRLGYLATPVDFYRAIDGFILTSLYEGMSIAALEAMACDLPLILSEVPGNQCLIRLPLSHLESAPAGDVERFARAILNWAAARRAPPFLGPSNHRAIAVEQFDNRTSYARVLALYRSLRPEESATPWLEPSAASRPAPPDSLARQRASA